ncbi:MAG: 50S ribosomal protein L11 methyltransferase [Bacteroidia bacterium]|nr:50S ribosomal protein L11 methyltransferase [Bacteroidia bacterium]
MSGALQDYLQITWKTNSELQEVILCLTGDIFEAFEQNDNFLHAYIPAAHFNESKLKEVIDTNSILRNLPYQVKLLPAQNWNQLWEAEFEPVSLFPDLLIRATHHNHQEDVKYKHVIQIQPKMAFGTGHHETTQMMLKAMQLLDFRDKDILDVGCGSGILSIYASFLGAKDIFALDIDILCIENTKENAILNQVSNIQTYLGSIETFENHLFDIVLANINRNVILQQLQSYLSRLKSKGFLVLSGFFESDVKIIENEAMKYELNCVRVIVQKGWACVVYQK